MEADRLFKKILAEQGHSNSDANLDYGLMLSRAGRSSDALQYLQRGKRLSPIDPLLSFYLSAAIIKTYYDLEGDYPQKTMLRLADILLMEDNEAALSELRELSKGPDVPPITRMYLAHFASVLGDPELAFESFIKSEADDVPFAIWHPIHKGIRQLPAFKTWVRKTGLYDYWRNSGKWADSCWPVGDDDFVCD